MPFHQISGYEGIGTNSLSVQAMACNLQHYFPLKS